MSFNKPLRSMSNFKDSVSSAGSFGSFNSSTSSFSRLGSLANDDDFKEHKQCYICNRKFTITMRRHHCRDCKESVCDEHSVIRYMREGKSKKLRICDNCDKKHIKLELQENMLNEITALKAQIDKASELNERLYREKYERTARKNNLEMKIVTTEQEAKRKEEDLENRLKEEIDSNAKAKARIADYMKRIEEMKETEQEITSKLTEETQKSIKLKSEKEAKEAEKLRLEEQESKLQSNIKDLFQIDDLKKLACEDCNRKLALLEKPRMSLVLK
ncbi:hypothetical protein SteCoe_4649 [Stentor coeruleus]|uniref:FYVE-type domain-containing protein n=1 Tax=Stentor coeruleus TaxID=5963 RepID=A0A1R2CU73_9CILI|nr:hypothetical protein SteCoe_4649 [Stentor coeruleus]